MEKLGNITLYNADCMEIMKGFSDKQFDLALVDPPYGIGFGNFNRTNKAECGKRVKANKYKNSNWDSSAPADDYFIELKRISKNQIVWGGNYFEFLANKQNENLKTIEQFNNYINKSDQSWIFWYKQNPVPNFADGELAWCSFENVKDQFNFKYFGNIEGNTSASNKIHPTQKPVALYKWLLNKYAKAGDTILDTHLGSGSSAIAAHDGGFEFTGIELDEEYYNAAKQRLILHQRQLNLF